MNLQVAVLDDVGVDADVEQRRQSFLLERRMVKRIIAFPQDRDRLADPLRLVVRPLPAPR
jgi:hypothetical protein